jgi:hypothetical protein
MNVPIRCFPGARHHGFAVVVASALFASSLLLSRAQETVPAPTRAFKPDAALILYADLQTASRSGIWKTIGTQLAPWAEQMAAMSGLPAPTPGRIETVRGLESEDMAELAVVVAGRNALQNLESGRFDPDFSLLAVGRFVRSLDTDEVIGQILEAIETEQPGSRARIEPTRTRVGPAEFFDLPADLFPDVPMPFPVAAAIGQGQDGTVFGFGKSDSLRAFLTGQAESGLPPGLAGSLSRRGQIWLYLPLNESIRQSFTEGAGTDNPMMAGLTQGLDNVTEFGLGASFGSAKVDIEVALGCRDNATARELAQNMQQFLGLMQMMSAQDPTSVPPFVGKLRAASDGSTFRLTTEITARDLDMAMQTLNPGATTQRRPAPGSRALPPVEVPEVKPDPVAVEFLELLPGDMQSLRQTRLRIRNDSEKPVRDIRVTFRYHDQRGQRIGQWTRRHMDPVSDILVGPQTSREVQVPTFHVPSTTRRVTLILHDVTFADGSRWVTGR